MSSTKKRCQLSIRNESPYRNRRKVKLIPVKTTTAKVHDSEVLTNFFHGEEHAVFADKAYANKEKKRQWRPGKHYWGPRKSNKGENLHPLKRKNRKNTLCSFGSRTPLPYHQVFVEISKVRYKGLFKNTVQIFTLCFLC